MSSMTKEQLGSMERPESADVSVRLLAGILSAIHELDGAPTSPVQPLQHATQHTSNLLHVENNEWKARIFELEANLMALEAQGQ
jgi:hypothetical protein